MTFTFKSVALVFLLIVSVCSVIHMAALAFPEALPEVSGVRQHSYSRSVIEDGEQLASVGDCVVCHTAPGGTPFSGGRALPTPFGTIYSSNITPDVKTGIGAWSFDAFRRAMREGVGRDGSQLYPAFPYNHFNTVTDADLKAVFAFLMTRDAVSAQRPANDLVPPLGFRPLLAGWKFLFLNDDPFEDDPKRSAEWNRGRYLVEGLAHCGACHTPRNLLGAEEASRDLAGGMAEGYLAPPLDAHNPMAESWSREALFSYLKTGLSSGHGAAAGPMAPVSEGLSRVNDDDVRAIAVYVSSRMHKGLSDRKSGENTALTKSALASEPEANPHGAALFGGACAGCHGPNAPMLEQGRASLSDLYAVNAKDPRNAIQALLGGIMPAVGERGAYMPAFEVMSDQDLADLLGYVRTRFTSQPPWTGLIDEIAKARKENAAK